MASRCVTGRIARLSLAAVQMAASAGPSEPAALARWLYRFGSLPRAPAHERDFGPDDEPLAVLGLSRGGATRLRLEAAYEASSIAGWYSFARAGQPVQWAAACKLYVSPRPAALPDAFAHIVDAFIKAEVRSFKVGRGIEGLLRPDKLIAYFDEPDQMSEVAQVLKRQLRGCPVQGVPFTYELGGDGLLSSGVDPPLGNVASSWRSWVTARLASALIARRQTAPANIVAAVLDDLCAAGIDTTRWQADPVAFAEPVPA
ncbi:hypothetical protein [Lysobacter tyrosinilyticus]